jgi:hypothetical protein
VAGGCVIRKSFERSAAKPEPRELMSLTCVAGHADDRGVNESGAAVPGLSEGAGQ